jgi:hypothetical protein
MDAWLAGLDKKAASARIDKLMASPKKPKPTAHTESAGATGYAATAKKGDVHVVDGEYFRVHVSQRTGHAYANKALIIETAVWDGDTITRPGTVKWEYAPGVIKTLSPDTFATVDEAAAFGKMVGRCCFCSTPIDTKESIAAGYGPVCAQYRGLPWGEAETELVGEISAAPDVLGALFAEAVVVGDAE